MWQEWTSLSLFRILEEILFEYTQCIALITKYNVSCGIIMNGLLLHWDMFPLCLPSEELLSQMGEEFCQKLSLPILRWLNNFYSSVC